MNKIILFFISILCLQTFASTITAIKGQKALVEFEGDEAIVGEEYFAINPENGKKLAILVINQVKGNKAVAIIKKGKAAKGFELRKKSAGGSSGAERGSAKYKRVGSNVGGFLAELNSNSMSVQISTASSTATTNMTGTSFGLGGFFDYALSDSFYIQTNFMYEQFQTAGPISNSGCTGSANCTTDLSYLSGYGLLRYNLTEGKAVLWLGIGGGFQYPMSKTSNALNTANITYNSSLTMSAGVDLFLSGGGFVPFWFQYNSYPDTSSVKGTSMIQIMSGYGWSM